MDSSQPGGWLSSRSWLGLAVRWGEESVAPGKIWGQLERSAMKSRASVGVSEAVKVSSMRKSLVWQQPMAVGDIFGLVVPGGMDLKVDKF